MDFALDGTTSNNTVITNQFSGDVSLDWGKDLWYQQFVVQLVGFSLGDWACDVVATVGVDAWNLNLNTVNFGDDLDFQFLWVLVGNKVSLEFQVLSLVDDTVVTWAVGDVEVSYFIVTFRSLEKKRLETFRTLKVIVTYHSPWI